MALTEKELAEARQLHVKAMYRFQIYNSFSDKLRLARSNAGLTRKQLAEKLDISYYSLMNYEAGYEGDKHKKKFPPFDLVIRLAAACNISVQQLVPDKYKRMDEYHDRDFHFEHSTQYIQDMLKRYFEAAGENDKRRVVKYIISLYNQGKEVSHESEHADQSGK